MAKAARRASKREPTERPLPLPPLHEAVVGAGLPVVVARRGTLPIVSARLIIGSGSANDPRGKYGLADFTSRLLKRGTARRSADALNEAVEFFGASLGVGASEDFVGLSLNCLSEHLPRLLELLGEMLREPSFPEEEVEQSRNRTLAQLANDLDEPSHVAGRAFTHAFFGAHPYGHDVGGAARHVRTFTREDVVRFHAENMGPKVSLLVVVGDVVPQEVFAAAQRAFAGWVRGPGQRLVLSAPKGPAHPRGVVLVDKEDQTQTQIRMGALAFGRAHPDVLATGVVNAAFGGGFTSRLVEEIRVRRGLTYGVNSYLDSMQATGALVVGTFTKTESTREVLEVVLAEAERLRGKGLRPGELAAMQTYLSGLYPLRMETNEALAGGICDVRFHGLPADWMASYRTRVRAVTLARAREVAARYFFPDGAAIVLVGNARKVKPQLRGLGPVKVVPLAELE